MIRNYPVSTHDLSVTDPVNINVENINRSVSRNCNLDETLPNHDTGTVTVLTTGRS